MDDNQRIEKWTLDDGRRAERRVMEQKNDGGQSERVIELHVEDERPLRLQQRVIEKTKPFTYERRIETLDPKTGDVVDQKVESIEPRTQMQLVEHIATSNSVNVASQSVEEEYDCHVTKEEMIETVIAAIKATREVAPEPQVKQQPLQNKLNSLGLAEEISTRANATEGLSTKNIVIMAVIAAQVIFLGYVIFWM